MPHLKGGRTAQDELRFVSWMCYAFCHLGLCLPSGLEGQVPFIGYGVLVGLLPAWMVSGVPQALPQRVQTLIHFTLSMYASLYNLFDQRADMVIYCNQQTSFLQTADSASGFAERFYYKHADGHIMSFSALPGN